MSDNGRSAFAYDGWRLDPKWPGIKVGDGVDMHHPSVRNLLKALREDVERLKGVGAGTPQHLRAYGKVTTSHVGEWDAAQQLGVVFDQGHTAITTGYDRLVAQYEAAIAVIEAAYQNIGKAEHASDVGLKDLT